MTVPVERLSLAEAWQHVATTAITELSPASFDRYRRIWRNFERFAARVADVHEAALVDRALVVAFLDALAGYRTPAPKTKALRLYAIRYLFRELRKGGLVDHDPTLDLSIETRVVSTFAALTDRDVDRCRWVASVALDAADRYCATWALLEAGLTTGEAGMAVWGDINVVEGTSNATITVPSRSFGRSVDSTPWGAEILCRVHPNNAEAPVAVLGSSTYDSRRTSVTHVVREIFTRAGISGAQPRSVTAWVAARVFADTGDVTAAARVIGFESLDRAAELIRLDWRRA